GQESLRPALGIASDLTIDPDGAVARTLETGTVQDYSAGGTSVLTLPLLADSDCIGAMAIARQRSANISDDEYTMIATLSGTLAAALQTAQLYVERSQYEQDLLEMQRISRLVASSLDTSAILQEIVTSLLQLFEADGCYVRIVDGDDLVPLTGQGTLTQSVPERVPIATSIAGSVVREKKVVSAYDLQARPDTAERLYAHHNPTRGWAAAPL